jgi:hypothetical protein
VCGGGGVECMRVTYLSESPFMLVGLTELSNITAISCIYIYRTFNLKVDRQLSREYFTSDAIYNGSAGMTFYFYMCRSCQDCCRRGENRSWPSVSVESVDSECWCLNNTIFYAFIMRLTVEEYVFILESYLKTMSYPHCR